MPTVTVRTTSSTVVFPDARAVLVEYRRSEHLPHSDGAAHLTVVERRAEWTIACPTRVDGWLGAVRRAVARPGERSAPWEYAIAADLVNEVTVRE